jgi:hypothetical protein
VQRLQTRAVMLEAKQPVELEPGVVLPPGYHTANETRSSLETVSGDVIWTEPEYNIELTADQLARIGAKGAASRIFVRYSVTKFVRLGQLTPT